MNGEPYSMDLRERVVDVVERDGLSCSQAAARFEVAVSKRTAFTREFVSTKDRSANSGRFTS
jgi:transposase